MGVNTVDMYQQITDYLCKNHPALHELPQSVVAKIVFKYPEKLIVERDLDFNILGVGFFCKVSDKDLLRIKDKTLKLTIVSNMEYLFEQEGENIHFLFAVSKGFKTIWKGLHSVIEWEKPKTVSWFSQDMKRFNIKTIRR